MSLSFRVWDPRLDKSHESCCCYQVPDYYTIIKDPIDIQTIETKMQSSKYFSLSLLMADLRRMTKNAKRYNSPDTIYFKAANKIEACIEQALAEVLFDTKTQVK